MHRAIQQVLERVEKSRNESDFSCFFSLLLAGEALVKTVTLGMIAAIGDDKDYNRYRLEHTLVRADGLGEWARALDDALTGTASQYLLSDARAEQAQLSKLCRPGEWQYASVSSLKAALTRLHISSEELPAKTDMKRWVRLFVTLRNKTRGHGATVPSQVSSIIPDLETAIRVFSTEALILQRPWAFFHRNLSGKYRVSTISGDDSCFAYLKRERTHTFKNGVFINIGSPRSVPLMETDPELDDFLFSNGGATGKRFELLSYATGDRSEGDCTAYSVPPGALPPSETEGLGELVVKGNCFSNVPDLINDYVARPALEKELRGLLTDDRRPIITLVGRGGIGKTSLSIKVIQDLYASAPYSAVIWLSARDIDLQLTGPKPVRPFVISQRDMATLYASLVLSEDTLRAKQFDATSFFETQLRKTDLGPCLFVFDNFETTQNPVDLYNWLDCHLRLPNKALITTRMRDFKGDYPLEIGGMNDNEARRLIMSTSAYLGIEHLLSSKYIEDLISQSEGHPYVMKILLGDVARTRKTASIQRIIAGSEEILTALFERTYAFLTPCAQRALMTLAAWNSSVPRLALEAVLMHSSSERQEVERGVESLIQFSLAEIHSAPTDQQVFIHLPLSARAFGRKKLNVSPARTLIERDVEVLQMLGPSRYDDVHLDLARRLETFITNMSQHKEDGKSLHDYTPIVEMMCRSYSRGWLILAQWYLENDDHDSYEMAKKLLRNYLEACPMGEHAASAWRQLAWACYKTSDTLGEIHAFIERAQLESVAFCDISNTANRINSLFRDQDFLVDKEQKRDFAERLLVVLTRRKDEANADDFSRMAWLARRIGQDTLAENFARSGLGLDPENYHCRNFCERIGINA